LVTAAYGKEINARHIDALVPQSSQEDLFPFIDAVVGGNTAAAFQILSGDKADDDVVSRYLNQLASRADKGQAIGAAQPSDLDRIAKQVGATNPSSIQRTFARANPRSFAEDVLESDRRLKSGKTRSPSEQLQEIIVRRASKTRGR
jgi:DNA polymerase III delta subunit